MNCRMNSLGASTCKSGRRRMKITSESLEICFISPDPFESMRKSKKLWSSVSRQNAGGNPKGEMPNIPQMIMLAIFPEQQRHSKFHTATNIEPTSRILWSSQNTWCHERDFPLQTMIDNLYPVANRITRNERKIWKHLPSDVSWLGQDITLTILIPEGTNCRKYTARKLQIGKFLETIVYM